MDFEKDIKINEDTLDIEFIRHPAKFFAYAEQLAYTEKIAKHAHEHVKVIKSKLTKEALSNPSLVGGGKATAVAIEAYYRLDQEYIEAKERWIKDIYERDMALNAVQAMNGKKTSLENLVRLHGQQYFAGPSVPRDLKEEIEKEKPRLTNSERKRPRREK